ncbi:YqcI/YcgG family protein [Halomonas janggokensis]|uniref:YqcI/YcgG family protein n=1 Tax=Vreelandella janggokensis TaxID=370767 RepID=A0ABT4IS75_9GAMM|nr:MULTISPECIES: YqcI/YcgG family protein [Halomonas]MCZ0925852.1 YqcI/YcgG family protein [Halomonas janggokensis]MCZ0930919.1 YqcI/YcgG family protein [Halomonas janggokensis]
METMDLINTDHAIHDKHSVTEIYQKGSWQRKAFNDFEETMTNKESPFPCVFGVHGLKQGHLRFLFHSHIDIALLSQQLREYVKNSRNFGNNTSLVLFTNIDQRLEIDEYHSIFWDTLKGLTENDSQPWPAEIPKATDDPKWEFCFAGEPIFVVCNTPSHVMRYSRHSTHFMLTFQPRWVFDNILGSPEQAKKAFLKVRNILKKYDATPLSPDLGMYGDPGILESRQYFLDDINKTKECPFKHLGD